MNINLKEIIENVLFLLFLTFILWFSLVIANV